MATFLRLYARWKQHIFCSDDALIVVLLVNFIAYAVLIILAKGFGKNVWDLEPESVTYTLKVTPINLLPESCFIRVVIDVRFVLGTASICHAVCVCQYADAFQTFHAPRLHPHLSRPNIQILLAGHRCFYSGYMLHHVPSGIFRLFTRSLQLHRCERIVEVKSALQEYSLARNQLFGVQHDPRGKWPLT